MLGLGSKLHEVIVHFSGGSARASWRRARSRLHLKVKSEFEVKLCYLRGSLELEFQLLQVGMDATSVCTPMCQRIALERASKNHYLIRVMLECFFDSLRLTCFDFCVALLKKRSQAYSSACMALFEFSLHQFTFAEVVGREFVHVAFACLECFGKPPPHYFWPGLSILQSIGASSLPGYSNPFGMSLAAVRRTATDFTATKQSHVHSHN